MLSQRTRWKSGGGGRGRGSGKEEMSHNHIKVVAAGLEEGVDLSLSKKSRIISVKVWLPELC